MTPIDIVCTEAALGSDAPPTIAVTYRIESGPRTGETIERSYVFSPDSAEALARFFHQMARHGLDRDFFAANPSRERLAASLLGKRIKADPDV